MSASAESLSHVEVNGVKLAYRESGSGEPMVLVHGHLSDYRTWTALESKLSDRFHVYSYSKRFAWPNEPIGDEEGQPWEQDADDLGALIEALNIGPVHALGNSSGSTVILLLARSKPHLFRTLLLEEPPLLTLYTPTLPPTPLNALTFFLWHPITFVYAMYYGAATIGRAIGYAKADDPDRALLTFGAGCLGPKYWPRAFADPERKAQIDASAKYLCNFLRYSTLPPYSAADARGVRVPTLVLTGAEGPYFQQCVDAHLLRLCGAERKREARVLGAGHLMHEDNPDGVFKEVVGFVGEGGGDS